MNSHIWHSKETPSHSKSLTSFEEDSVNGEEILGGGKGTVILPTADGTDPEGAINNNTDGTLTDGTINDGTLTDGSATNG